MLPLKELQHFDLHAASAIVESFDSTFRTLVAKLQADLLQLKEGQNPRDTRIPRMFELHFELLLHM